MKSKCSWSRLGRALLVPRSASSQGTLWEGLRRVRGFLSGAVFADHAKAYVVDSL